MKLKIAAAVAVLVLADIALRLVNPQIVRMFLDTASPDRAQLQCGPDEVAVPVQDQTFGTIETTADGHRVVPAVEETSGE